MDMKQEEKKNYVLLSRRRNGELADKKNKGAFLDQFCAATGMSRKNAIRRLSPTERPHRRRGRPFKADVAARNLLVRIWNLANLFTRMAAKESPTNGQMVRCRDL